MFYELHLGTSAPEGSFEGIIQRLSARRELGMTAIELMPVASLAGSRKGATTACTHTRHKTATGSRMACNTCSMPAMAQGGAVFLDVVHTHVGPEGGYFYEFCLYFPDRYHTPLGAGCQL